MTGKIILIHDFLEEDIRGVPIRFIPLETRDVLDRAEVHRHNYYEMFFFEKGGGVHLIDFKEHLINSQSIHFVYPGQVHLLQRSPDSYGSVVHFSEDIFRLSGIDVLQNNGVEVLAAANLYEEFHTLLAQLSTEYDKEKINVDILNAYLQIIILKCNELFTVSNIERKGVSDSFINFKLLVERDFIQVRSTSHFSEKLNISERRLDSICKTAIGISAHDFIKKRVLLEAKRLLYNSDLSIKEISFYLGFEDPSYFNRFFKKNQGTTAGAFRQKTIQ